ncbi:hypothetical protein FRC07_005381 [Ceratobasidium sp. 392]|nr:hypothetical protein FRC07_005381 [Ceratobasidium sp. 392]
MANSSATDSQWYSTYPTPSFSSSRMSPEDLAELIDLKVVGVDYIVIDVRQTDFESMCIKGAINLPAQSFYPTISTITTMLSHIPEVIFHCNSCKETGRGPRVAGWYAMELRKRGIETSKAWILDGGVKRFCELYGDSERLVFTL